jgi:hypothetical protein
MHLMKQFRVTAYDAGTHTVTLQMSTTDGTDTQNMPLMAAATSTLTLDFGLTAALPAEAMLPVGAPVLVEIKTL